MRVRGGARHPTCLAYRLPVAAAVTAATVVAASAPAGESAVTCEKGAVQHTDSQMYRNTASSSSSSAAAAAAVDGDESGAISRELALAAQLLDVRRRARNEHDYWKKRVDEMRGAVVAYQQRAEDVEKNLKLATVSRVNY